VNHTNLPAFTGVYKDLHGRVIPESKLADGSNLLFREGTVRQRWGYLSIGSNLPLNGAVTGVFNYKKTRASGKYLIVTTTRDTYLYDWDTGVWDFITKIFITGTVSCSAGTTVTGVSTAWDYTNYTAGNLKWQIAFSTQDPNSSPTWYTISSFTSATVLELTAAGPTASGVNYVIRMTWTGDVDDYHSAAFPFDPAGSPANTTETMFMVCNGIDLPQRWTGTGYMITVTGGAADPPIAKFLGYFGSVGYEHTVVANTIVSSISRTQAIQASDAGTPFDWGSSGWNLQNDDSPIKGVVPLKTRLIVYKADALIEAWVDPSGGDADPFNFNQAKAINIGTPSIRTVVNIGDYHIFFGWNNVYRFDGISPVPIGDDLIKSAVNSVNREKLDRAHALHLARDGLYVLFLPVDEDNPDEAFAFNYKTSAWSQWTFADAMTANGAFIEQNQNITIDELTNNIDTYTQRFDDMLSYEQNVRYLVGDESGNVYRFNPRYLDDDGTNITSYLTTRDYPINDPRHSFYLLEAVVGLVRQTNVAGEAITTTMTVEASVDFGVNWSAAVTITVTGDDLSAGYDLFTENIVNFYQRGNQVRFRISNVSGSTFELENLIVGFNTEQGYKR